MKVRTVYQYTDSLYINHLGINVTIQTSRLFSDRGLGLSQVEKKVLKKVFSPESHD